jgi:hypothetical protein
MVPKPDIEWVKRSLESMNIRVVNDRPGRRKKRTIDDLDMKNKAPSFASQSRLSNLKQRVGYAHVHRNPEPGFQVFGRASNSASANNGGSISSEKSFDRRLSDHSQYGNESMQMNLFNQQMSNLPSHAYALGGTNGMNTNNSFLSANSRQRNEGGRSTHISLNTQQQLSNLAFGSSQHYEVLREHHMNLLTELQETTSLMNMYHQNSNKPNIESLYGAQMQQNRGSLDQTYLDQNYSRGANQYYPSSNARRDSLGLGGQISNTTGNMRRDSLGLGGQISNTIGLSQLGQLEEVRRDSLMNGIINQLQPNEMNRSNAMERGDFQQASHKK